ncbi:hypothetical protein PYCC9005_005160 [Savitreella phatthalungensis]
MPCTSRPASRHTPNCSPSPSPDRHIPVRPPRPDTLSALSFDSSFSAELVELSSVTFTTTTKNLLASPAAADSLRTPIVHVIEDYFTPKADSSLHMVHSSPVRSQWQDALAYKTPESRPDSVDGGSPTAPPARRRSVRYKPLLADPPDEDDTPSRGRSISNPASQHELSLTSLSPPRSRSHSHSRPGSRSSSRRSPSPRPPRFTSLELDRPALETCVEDITDGQGTESPGRLEEGSNATAPVSLSRPPFPHMSSRLCTSYSTNDSSSSVDRLLFGSASLTSKGEQKRPRQAPPMSRMMSSHTMSDIDTDSDLSSLAEDLTQPGVMLRKRPSLAVRRQLSAQHTGRGIIKNADLFIYPSSESEVEEFASRRRRRQHRHLYADETPELDEIARELDRAVSAVAKGGNSGGQPRPEANVPSDADLEDNAETLETPRASVIPKTPKDQGPRGRQPMTSSSRKRESRKSHTPRRALDSLDFVASPAPTMSTPGLAANNSSDMSTEWSAINSSKASSLARPPRPTFSQDRKNSPSGLLNFGLDAATRPGYGTQESYNEAMAHDDVLPHSPLQDRKPSRTRKVPAPTIPFSRLTSSDSIFEDDSEDERQQSSTVDPAATSSRLQTDRGILSKLVKSISTLTLRNDQRVTPYGKPASSVEGKELRFVRDDRGHIVLIYEKTKYSSVAVAGTIPALLAELLTSSTKLTDPTSYVDHLLNYHALTVTHSQFLQLIIHTFWRRSDIGENAACNKLVSLVVRWMSQNAPRDWSTSETMQEMAFVFATELRAASHFTASREIECSLTLVLNADARHAAAGEAASISQETLDAALARANALSVQEANAIATFPSIQHISQHLDFPKLVQVLASTSLYLLRAVLVPESIAYWLRSRQAVYRGSSPVLIALSNVRRRNAMLANWVSPSRHPVPLKS